MNNAGFYFIPNTNIHTLGPISELDFFDKQTVVLPHRISPLEAWAIVMSHPMPIMKLAFRVRDAISALFGVKKIGGFSGVVPETVTVGQKLDFFLVEHISKDVLTLTARDRHLDVMTCISIEKNALTITSSVKTHNLFGRFYMIPVAPAHKMIARRNLGQIRSEVERY